MPRTNNNDMAVDRRDVDSTTAEAVSYDPIDRTKWPGNVDPGNVNDALDQLAAITGLGAAHNLLDGSIHPDTDVDACSQGSLIYGNPMKQWDEMRVSDNPQGITISTHLLHADLADVGFMSIDDLAADGAPQGAADYVMSWDATAAEHKKVLLNNLLALIDIVNDLTPQLGGDLDVNGQSIISIANGDIPVSPHGTGEVILDGVPWPLNGTGSNTDWLLYTVAGKAYWANFSELNVPAGGVDAAADWLCVYDTSGTIHAKVQVDDLVASSAPAAHVHDGDTLQHDAVNSNGGAFPFTTTGAVTFNQNVAAANYQVAAAGEILDANGNELIGFGQTVNAVNELTITNAATTNAPEIAATGDDVNIDLKLTPKGGGDIYLDGSTWLPSGAYMRFRASTEYVRSSAVNMLDIGAGIGGLGTINFRLYDVFSKIEMDLTANNLTFNNGVTDTALNWDTDGRLKIMAGGVELAHFRSGILRLVNCYLRTDYVVCGETVAVGGVNTLRFGDEVLAPASGAPSWPDLPSGSWGGTGGWWVVFNEERKGIVPWLEDDS